MSDKLNVRGRPEPAPRDDRGRYKKDRVICTHLAVSGQMDKLLWEIDAQFSQENISRSVIRGYHFWAVPYVRLMRKSRLAEVIILPLAVSRAEDIAFRVGKRSKPNYLGRVVRILGEPICWCIGQFVPEQDWQSLYSSRKAS